ncbi:MAG: DMT family transporter [Eubacterium sp.]
MSKGVIAAVSAAFCAGTIPIFTKFMLSGGLTPVAVLFYRYLSIVIILGVSFLMRKKNICVTGKQFLSLIFFTVFGYGGATLLLAISLNFLSVGLSTMLYFTYPLFVMMIMIFFFKEKPTWIKVVSLFATVFGIVCLMNFDKRVFTVGSLLAIGAGLAYSVYLVGIRKSALKELENRTIVFYLSAISTILFLGQGLLMEIPNFLTISPLNLLYGALLGIITIFVLSVVTYAIKTIGPTKTSLIISFEAVVSLILGILIFAEPYNINTWIGSILMTAAVILMTREGEKEENEEALRCDTHL